MEIEFLVCTNGHESTWPAIQYGTWAAQSFGGHVTLLGISENAAAPPADHRDELRAMVDRAIQLFVEKGVRHAVSIEKGAAEQVVAREAGKRDCIVVLGPLGRAPVRRFFLGRSIRQLLEEVTPPVLYVPTVRLPLQKMLICLGGLGYEATAENLAVRMGLMSKAEVTLLHVAPPVNLDYPAARAEHEHWRDLVDTDTLIGRNLRNALALARTSGLSAAVKTRQGNIIEEILAEVKDGNYDLVCLGSPSGTHGLRHLYEPNVTEEVAEHAGCPILVARYVRSVIEPPPGP